MPHTFKGQPAYSYRPSATRRPSGLNAIRQSPSPMRVTPVRSARSPSPNKYKKTQKGRFTVYSPKKKSPARSPKKTSRFKVYTRVPVNSKRFKLYIRKS